MATRRSYIKLKEKQQMATIIIVADDNLLRYYCLLIATVFGEMFGVELVVSSI